MTRRIMSDYDETDWRPAATRDRLVRRAELLTAIRRFFDRLGVLEVETPILSSATTVEPHLHALTSRCQVTGDRDLYLHTSPEFPMKRLLAAGSGSIYQIARVFRDGESGRRHNPEFTLLEWYRTGFDHIALMGEVAALLSSVSAAGIPEPLHLTYREAFLELAGVDPFVSVAELRDYAAHEGIACDGDGADSEDIDFWRDLILVQRVEPGLDPERPTFIHDYPASQAALARVRDGEPPLAERFELYWRGLELANGFHELRDADEQARRFSRDRVHRLDKGLPDVPEDRRLLAALRAGSPECAGVALGIDRLLMALTGADHINEVLAFPLDRA